MDHATARLRFAEQLRLLRQRRGLNQEQLAEEIGRGTEHVSLLERARRSPSFETICDLATALDVPINVLMGLDAPLDLTAAPDLLPIPPVDLRAAQSVAAPVASPTERAAQLDQLQTVVSGLAQLQDLAAQYGVVGSLAGTGGRLLQVLLLLGLRGVSADGGWTAADNAGATYQVRVLTHGGGRLVNVPLGEHIDGARLAAYRAASAWYVAIYRPAALHLIYRLEPALLASRLDCWGRVVEQGKSVPNPAIPMTLVRRGEVVYGALTDGPA